MIESSSSLVERPISRATRGLFDRVYPFWSGDEIVKHVHPIRKHARKLARSPFLGSEIVAASTRIERAGMPAARQLSDMGREYASFQDCEQLVASLAGRVGNPQIAPVPRVWPLLAIVLLEWRGTISASAVVAHAATAGLSEQAQRGLVIVTYLFPELQSWLAQVRLGIPLWERVLAVPLAARKLVLLDKSS